MSIVAKFTLFVETYSAGVIAATLSVGFAGYIMVNGRMTAPPPNIVIRHNPVVSPLTGSVAGRTVPKQWSPDEIALLTGPQLITGSLPKTQREISGRIAKQDQPQVRANQKNSNIGQYVLRVATEKIALVEGLGKLWSVRPGGLLPGSGRVLEIVRRDEKWIVVTTHGEIKQ